VEGLWVLLGAVVGIAGSLLVQWTVRRSSSRTAIYLEFLPGLERTLIRYHRVAVQDRNHGPLWVLRDSDWITDRDTDQLRRQAIIAGGRDLARAIEIVRRWANLAKLVDPELGTLTSQVLGEEKVTKAAQEALDAVRSYQAWLERRFLRRLRRIEPSARPGVSSSG
jgi:hypothetical protein